MRLALALLIAALAPAAAAPRSCPEGQDVNVDTDGHCCWPGQVWSKTRHGCIGVPQCPDGFDAFGEESCAKRTCEAGQVMGPDTAGHCCWPAQVWSKSRNVCIGVPQCPAGFEVAGEACTKKAPACPPGQAISADTEGHCCWPAQVWSNSRNTCIGTPQCPQDREIKGETCVTKPPPCPIGKVIGPDTEGHCCWPTQVWSASRSVCVGTPQCPPTFTVDGQECRGTPPPEPTPAPTPAPAPDGESSETEPTAKKKIDWRDFRPAFGALIEGYYITVPGTRTTVAGGAGIALRGGAVHTIPVDMGTMSLKVRAGIGLDLTGGGDSPEKTNSVTGIFYLQIPIYIGAELHFGDSFALGLDWQPTIVVVAGNGHDAEAMNPLGFALTGDLLTVKAIPKVHPRASIWFLPPVVGMPLTLGFGVGASWF